MKLVNDGGDNENKKKDKSSIFVVIANVIGVSSMAFVISAVVFAVLLFGVISFAFWHLKYQGGIKPPYNAIDFKQVAYIDNQFVIYGIDYDKPKPYSLVIFNSTYGESWDKSEINFTPNQAVNISYQASFNYFKGQCYLFGQTLSPLVASDCRHWHNQAIEIESATNVFNELAWGVPGSVVVKDMIYISTNSNGVYSSKDGIKWQNESLPNPDGNEYPLEFGSIAAGNNKIIVEARMHRNKKLIGVIYTKDLKTNSWSYQVYPETVHNITRGKDRFVGATNSGAITIEGNKNDIESVTLTTSEYDIKHGFGGAKSLAFGVHGSFVGVNRMLTSQDGLDWMSTYPDGSQDIWALSVACSEFQCIGIGDNYHLITTNDGISWKLQEFEHKNPPRQLGWYHRLLNRLFFTKN